MLLFDNLACACAWWTWPRRWGWPASPGRLPGPPPPPSGRGGPGPDLAGAGCAERTRAPPPGQSRRPGRTETAIKSNTLLPEIVWKGELGNQTGGANGAGFKKNSKSAGSIQRMICWWPKTGGDGTKPWKVSKLQRQGLVPLLISQTRIQEIQTLNKTFASQQFIYNFVSWFEHVNTNMRTNNSPKKVRVDKVKQQMQTIFANSAGSTAAEILSHGFLKDKWIHVFSLHMCVLFYHTCEIRLANIAKAAASLCGSAGKGALLLWW